MRWVARIAAAVVLTFAAMAQAAPKVRAGSSVTATVVACQSAIDCWFARQLVPRAWLAPSKVLVVDEVEVVGAWSALTIASGERAGDTMPPDAISLGGDRARVTAGTAVVPVVLRVEDLPPDRYHGTVRFGGGELTTAEIPLDVSVRSGPGGALLWLVAGVAIGLLLKYWRDRGRHWAATATELDRVVAWVRAGPLGDLEILEPLLAEARAAVHQARLREADEAISQIKERSDLLRALARLEEALPSRRAEISRVRSMIARGRIQQARDEIAKLEEIADASIVTASARSLRGASERRALEEVSSEPEPPLLRRTWLWMLRHVVGRALRVGAVVAAVLLGLKVMYLDGGATYGASPFFDGIALFLWGLGAEVSSRGLSVFGELLAPRGESAPAASLLGPTTSGPASAFQQGAEERRPKRGSRLRLPSDVEIRDSSSDTRGFARGGGWPYVALELEDLSRRGLEGHGVAIAVIDTGVASGQSALDWSRIRAMDLRGGTGEDMHGHGTCMVGILASDRGVCPRASVISIRTIDSDGTAAPVEIAEAIDLAIGQGVDVISISAGQEDRDPELDAAVQRARAAGVLVVAAIRNENPDGSSFPARCSGVTSVTPSGADGRLRHAGPPSWISIAAPGQAIPTYGRAAPAVIDGSSAATAVVAGVCARLLSSCQGDARRELAKRLDEVLRATATTQDGGRLLDVLKATQAIQEEE